MDLFKSFHNPTADVNHSVFDLSCRRIFSSKAGQCIPALVLDTVPSDKFRINMQALMRSNTLNTPAFVRGKFNYDFFFVPYTQLWHRFNDFVTQKRDLHTSYFTSIDVPYCPSIELRTLLDVLLACYFDEESEIGTFIENDLGYYFNYVGTSAYSDYKRGYIRENLRLLNMLGYGNFEYLCDYQDYSQAAIEIDLIAGDGTAGQPKLYINPFRLLAYQHIWYDIYRNKYFDQDSINIDRRQFMYYFNADDVDCSSLGNSRRWGSSGDYKTRFIYMTTLHYCQWKKDIYTAVVPSQQFGVVSSVDMLSSIDVGAYSNDTQYLTLGSSRTKIGYSNVATSGSTQNPLKIQELNPTVNSSFDVLSLRRAEALQKWKEAALRAGNMNDKNQKAHFGVEPYYYEDNNVHFLGSFDGTFQINPVQSTAATSGDNGAVGDLAATGTSVVANGHEIEFDCRDYGIIMCIERFVPESEYSATGIERSNQRFEPFDYYQPEFSRLGLQAVPLVEQSNDSYVYSDKNFVLGYAPRDYDYKQMQDKVYGEFMTYHDGQAGFVDGSFAPWVSPRQETLVSVLQGSPNGRGIDSFYVHPNVFDNVFKAQANSNAESDQFVHQCYFDIKAVRPMPVLGLPEF